MAPGRTWSATGLRPRELEPEVLNPTPMTMKSWWMVLRGLIGRWLRRANQNTPTVSGPDAPDAVVAYEARLARLMTPPSRRPPTPEVRRVVMLTISALRVDPRIEREARALAGRGFEVVVVGPDISTPPHADDPLDWGSGVSFDLQSADDAQFIFKPPYFVNDTIVEAAARHEAFAVHGHDHWTSLIAMQVAERTGARLAVDYHEWSSENVSWDYELNGWAPHPPEKAEAFRALEIAALRRADLAITVNQTIARALEEMAGLSVGAVQTVRNIPPLALEPTRTYPPLKEQLGIPVDRPVVLYQGGTGPSRLLEPIIEALALAPDLIFVIRGPSLDIFGDGYRTVAERAGVSDRVMLVDAVPSRDVVAAARGADVGVWTLPDLGKNFRLALPNKIFEYLASGLPIAVAHWPEAARIVNDYGCGLTFDPYDPASIAAALTRLAVDPAERQARAARVPVALEGLQADREWEKFADLYESLWLNRNLDRPDAVR